MKNKTQPIVSIPLAEQALSQAKKLSYAARHDEAETLYAKILKDYPHYPFALLDYGMYLARRQKTQDAIKIFDKLLTRNPDFAPALLQAALAYQETGQQERAHYLAQKARTSAPDPVVLIGLGQFYRNAGLRDDAITCLEAAIAKDPRLVSAYFNLHDLRKFSSVDDPYFKNLLMLYADRAKYNAQDQCLMLFTLARACLHMGDTDKAFEFFEQGNGFRKSMHGGYNMARQMEYIDLVIKTFDTEMRDKLRALGGNDSTAPIFIVGLPRSGSTLVEQILTSHPDVGGMGEVAYFMASVPHVPNTELENAFQDGIATISGQFLETLDSTVLQGIAQHYLEKIKPHMDKKTNCIVDKMLFNYLWVGLIRVVFPRAKIIHCTRNPMDVGLSNWMHLFNLGAVPFAYDQNDIAQYYLSYKKLMDHWNALFPTDIYEASYEKLVSDQEGQTRKLLEYCNLPWDERVLKFYETDRAVITASAEQVRKAIYTQSVGKWQKYAQYLQPMKAAFEKAGVNVE